MDSADAWPPPDPLGEALHPSDRYEILRAGEGGAPTTLICGAVRFDHPIAHNLVGMLPQIVHIDGSDGLGPAGCRASSS